MNELRLNREINPNGQLLRDDKGNLTGISISETDTSISNLKLQTLTSEGHVFIDSDIEFLSHDNITITAEDVKLKSNDDIILESGDDIYARFNSATEAFNIQDNDTDVVTAKFWYVSTSLSALTIYEPDGTDNFGILTFANGATSVSTNDVAGNDAYLGLYPDGYLALRGKGGGTTGADLRIEYDANDYTRIDIDATGDITFATYDEGSQVQTGTSTWSGYSTFEINSTSGVSLKLAKDANDYATFAVADTGDLTITTVGDGSLDSDFTLDVDGDIELNADGGTVTIKDDSATHFLFGCDNTRFRIYDDTNANDFFTITVGDEGATSISTTDADTAVGHLTLVPDGDLGLDPASTKIIINATDDLFFDGGSDTYITESEADNLQFVVGGDQIVNMTENGTSGNHAHFKTSSVGFTTIAETFSDDSIIGSGGTHDTHIDFRHSNKISLAVTADITNLNLIFPMGSGNFVLVLTYDGDHDITNYKVYDSQGNAASGDADVLWAGGSAPATTPSGVDIFSFFWDSTAPSEKCYGVGSLNFGN